MSLVSSVSSPVRSKLSILGPPAPVPHSSSSLQLPESVRGYHPTRCKKRNKLITLLVSEPPFLPFEKHCALPLDFNLAILFFF